MNTGKGMTAKKLKLLMKFHKNIKKESWILINMLEGVGKANESIAMNT